MSDGDLLDAREAMSLLGINENDLQTLVARGDLRAFRSAGTMKFRRDDVSALKSDKGTEPTIIIPPSGQKKGSGILPTVGAAPVRASRMGSGLAPAQNPQQENATGEIVLDDIELMPTDDAANTQQVTIQQPAFSSGIGGQTVVDDASGTQGGMTVMEEGVVESPPTGMGSRRNVPAAPAMSRVRAAVAPGVSMATSRRTQAVYAAPSAGPVWTAVLVLTSFIFLLSASICGVMISRGHYDKASEQRIIPPFLSQNSTFKVYEWCYENTPGNPQDKKPEGEFNGKRGE